MNDRRLICALDFYSFQGSQDWGARCYSTMGNQTALA